MKTRIKWIDQSRAIAMILIVFGHALGQIGGEGGAVYNWLYLFHVPLCVVLSGFLFAPRNTFTETKKQMRKIVIHEYIPYLIWGFISIAIYTVVITRNVFTGGGVRSWTPVW